MSDKLSISDNAFAMRKLTSLSVDGIFLPSYTNWFTNFSSLPLKVVLGPPV